MAELEPCPFCGGPARSATLLFADEAAEVGCATVECKALAMVTADTEEDAIAAWNRRPSQSLRERRLAEALILANSLTRLEQFEEGDEYRQAVAEARAILSSPAPDPASEPRAIECRSTCARAGCQNLRPHWCSSCGEVDNWEDHYKFHGYCSDDCRAADEAPPFGAVR